MKTDKEILDALESGSVPIENLVREPDPPRWLWYDTRNKPDHEGWQEAESFRDAASKLIKANEPHPDTADQKGQ